MTPLQVIQADSIELKEDDLVWLKERERERESVRERDKRIFFFILKLSRPATN